MNMGIKTANKPDSQEICFVADNNYERFLGKEFLIKLKMLKKGI